MTKEQSNSIVNLGDLGKPADTLVKKISNAVGGIFAPYQVRRLAKAEAEAAVIQAQTDIQITDLHRRAVRRWIEEEAQRQENIETITTTALPLLNGDANAGAVDDDWIVNFFDKSRIVSDGQMRELWSRILAGEANDPGTYSKRTVNFISGLDKSEAELFTTLCGFACKVGTLVPLVFDSEGAIYNKHGINFNSLHHLEAVGLIKFGSLAGCAVVAAVEHDGQQLLRRGAGGGAADGDARHFQHRPGVAVYERGVHRPCPGCGRAVLDGRPRSVPG